MAAGTSKPRSLPTSVEAARRILAQLGDPHLALPAVLHVAGTNGKGSTVAMLESVLRHAGYRTGLTISPHLHFPGERIQLDGRPLTTDDLVRLLRAEVMPAAIQAGVPTINKRAMVPYTCAAFLAFARAGVDVAIVETGMGGCNDATNVFPMPTGTAITTVDFDHMDRLGDTLTAIATAKSGILRPSVPVVTGTDGDALAAIRAQAEHLGAPLIQARPLQSLAVGPRSQRAYFDGAVLGGTYEIGLVGDHQLLNAAIVLHLLEQVGARLPVDIDAVRRGLAEVRWPARLEQADALGVSWLFDGAHNGEGARALRAYLERHFPGYRLGLIYGTKAKRVWQPFAIPLQGLWSHVWTTYPPLPKRMGKPPENMATDDWAAPVTPLLRYEDAVFQAWQWAQVQPEKTLLVVAGQIPMVGAVRHYLNVVS